MAGLRAPLSTLRATPHDGARMTRGQCGSLHLSLQRTFTSTLLPVYPGAPQVPGRPCVYMPRSQTPADRRHLALDGACDAAFRYWNSVGSAIILLSRLYDAACTLSVDASQPGSPPDHAPLDSGWWLTLAGRDFHPLGRIEGFGHVCPSTSRPPSPSFAWRNPDRGVANNALRGIPKDLSGQKIQTE